MTGWREGKGAAVVVHGGCPAAAFCRYVVPAASAPDTSSCCGQCSMISTPASLPVLILVHSTPDST